MMKYLSILILCIASTLPMVAQSKYPNSQVSGQIVDKSTGEGIPYVTVCLKNDSLVVGKIKTSDVGGNFAMTMPVPSRYFLTITSFGYKNLTLPVNGPELKNELGKLTMEPENVELEQVTVTGQKPLVHMDLDKIVYSMESDPEAQSSSAMEMLRKVPLVTVAGDDNILLNGQSNFKILINGKTSALMSKNFKEVLKGFPANTIKDIEVITNPSSKYDAEGVGGIINIITLKRANDGYRGNVNSGINSRGEYDESVYLSAKVNKFECSVNYYLNNYKESDAASYVRKEYYNNDNYRRSYFNGITSYQGLSNSFSGDASYAIDSLNLISLTFSGYYGDHKGQDNSETTYLDSKGNITRAYGNIYDGKESYGSLSGCIDYQRSFRKPDKAFTLSYKLDNNPNASENFTNTLGITNYPTYSQHAKNEATGREQTFQMDYCDPLNKMHQIEGGIKFILRQNSSNSEIYQNDLLLLNENNNLDYNQYILGAYAGYLLVWQKVSLRTGVRAESCWNDGLLNGLGGDERFTNRLFNVVPSINLSFAPKTGQTVKLSYTQRLARPSIWYLNPYVSKSDSMNIRYGNPSLKAELSHAFELGYNLSASNFTLATTAFATLINNSIEHISTVEPNGATASTFKNIGKNQRYGLNIYTSFNSGSKFNIDFNGGINYCHLEANNGYAITSQGFNFRGSLGARCKLWKDASIDANGGVNTPQIQLQGKSFSNFYTRFGLSQGLLKNKLKLRISASDPFWHEKRYTFTSGDNTFDAFTELHRHAQSFKLSATYNFGSKELVVNKAKRSIVNDDQKGR